MRTYERDYRYLLEHVIPRHRLAVELRRDVDVALASGRTQDIRIQSVRALESLCRADYFERTGLGNRNGDVLVDYRRRGGRYRVRLCVPLAEWEGAVETGLSPEAGTGAAEERRDRPPLPTPASPTVAAPPLEVVTILPEIVGTFAAGDRGVTLFTRLESLLESLERWFGFARASLDVVGDAIGLDESAGERVRVVSEEDLRASALVKEAIETGAERIVERSDVVETDDHPFQWTALGVAPVFSGGKVQGVIRVYFGSDSSEEHLSSMSDVVRQVIEYQHQLDRLTSIDALTGLYNRHFYDTQLTVEIERATRSGRMLAMLILDIDDFKRINDEFGHKKGDEALVAVAELIRRNLRKVDMPFRYGGEEIVILLPGTSEYESVHTAERLRRVIGEYPNFKDVHGRHRQITVSVGVSVYPDTARTPEELFTQADVAMYRAKREGKNRVVLYSNASEGDSSGDRPQ